MVFHIVVNPAGASGKAWKLYQSLEPLFHVTEYKLHKSTRTKGIGDICRELTSRGEETALVIIGGDGTMNEAVNGIADFARTRVAFVPCGTGNDLERDMDIPKNKDDIILRMLDGEVKRTTDIGELTFHGSDGDIVRKFNISSDIGFGAATCAYANRSKLKPLLNRIGLGKLIYLIEAVKVCFTAKPATVEIICDGKKTSYSQCLCAIAMNHCYEGGGFKFCPNADFTDGKLDLCVGDGLSHPEFLRMLPNAYKGTHLRLRGISELRGERFEMRSAEPLWVHTDGEVLGRSDHVSMRILPEKLRLMI